ncbi:2-oxo-4-hydroxy-4-carboxy-5-ureidoimidazoline decarboxylase [Leptolyngbya cf. ectocarpi LEGE 11479]|uniref:2-oxo-4-hydroxy-4-carboxy-5-ureidoimidazoline decarboxylase n=1 Tax=Leptolyngbya cf. ectocarpi LEGE 11479 TaxID=1828722 RepID=A0A928ZZ50_LEPEC|nr:2-oxo-4-hydroxy-4-carboxy-5-ureidoimidazoline decarboxylase [Leptolyngbya ectocarpi]MBE9070174.1 2-oxo-4-hydroxy-4-carboxy-5-ureidoimidazoline decarboxylase [Leptolyngbya cf. ectocarpi LEGE 11479]
MAHTITELNQMTQADFVTTLGDVFEHTPRIAAQAWHQRPFTDVANLHQTMVALVEQMSETAQLDLIRAHPDLGSRVHMAAASVQEQTNVGLNRLKPSEYEQFQTLNTAYQTKFGFPFIMAIKGQTKDEILAAFTQRLQNTPASEHQRALLEIQKIARFRLDDLCDTDCDADAVLSNLEES